MYVVAEGNVIWQVSNSSGGGKGGGGGGKSACSRAGYSDTVILATRKWWNVLQVIFGSKPHRERGPTFSKQHCIKAVLKSQT
jgi:hypothetical protein